MTVALIILIAMSTTKTTKRNTLHTPESVKERLGLDIQVCGFTNIFKTEYNEAIQCIGLDFYEKLLEDLAVYDCEKYDATKTYQVGDKVEYNGLVRCATEISTGVIPSNNKCWTLAPTFQTPCLEELWCNFLCDYLAWTIFRSRLPFIWRVFGADGLVKLSFQNPKYQSADKKDFDTILMAVMREMEIAWENMDVFIKRACLQKGYDKCYDLFKPLNKTCGTCHRCTPCSCDDEDDCTDAHDQFFNIEFG